jgi:hypothetical protein
MNAGSTKTDDDRPLRPPAPLPRTASVKIITVATLRTGTKTTLQFVR